MGTKLTNWISQKRKPHLRFALAVSPFTIFLLGFGLIYWIMLLFTMVVTVECEYAIIWVSGWFDFASLFQWIAVSIGLCAMLWLARIPFLKSLNRLETIAQFVFILGLACVLVAQKAYLFPYGTPNRVQVENTVRIFSPNDLRLVEEKPVEFNVSADWKYDYPRPPFADRPEHPRRDTSVNRRFPQIFEQKHSPTWKEYQRMFTCYAGYQSAVSNYEKDVKAWNEYWEAFDDWYALNGWRYDR